MKAVGTWMGGFRTRLEDDRGHSVVVDLPTEEGGRNLGPSALELSVLSLAGCISTIFALVAQRRRLRYDSFHVDLVAARPAGSRTITSVEGTARIETSSSPEEAEMTLRVTLRTCPVGVLLEQAGVPVRVHALVVPTIPPTSTGPT